MSSSTSNVNTKVSGKITSFFPTSSVESTSNIADESPRDEITAEVFDATSCGSSTNLHENDGMSTPTDSVSKKRNASKSPVAESGILFKKPTLASVDDLFAEMLTEDPSLEKDTPRLVSLLFTSFTAVVNELKVVSAKIDAYESFKSDVSNKFNALNSTVDSLKADMECMKAEINIVKSENSELKNTIGSLMAQFEHNEQHSGNECLLLHGVPEKTNQSAPENSKLVFASEISSKVGVKMTVKDIKRAHRYGPPRRDGKSRPIIARFWDSSLRNNVYHKKRELKGKGIFVTENLTKVRMELYKKAIVDFGKQQVWSREGRIYAKDSNGKVINIIS